MPIELLSFSGKHSIKGNLLKWYTTTKKNKDYFDVEKSQNGVEFQKIDFTEISRKTAANIRFGIIGT